MERPFGFRVRERRGAGGWGGRARRALKGRRRPAVWVSRAGLDLKGRRSQTIHPLRARRHTGGESVTPSRHEGADDRGRPERGRRAHEKARPQPGFRERASAPARNRTLNLRIKSPLLCQLSYRGETTCDGSGYWPFGWPAELSPSSCCSAALIWSRTVFAWPFGARSAALAAASFSLRVCFAPWASTASCAYCW